MEEFGEHSEAEPPSSQQQEHKLELNGALLDYGGEGVSEELGKENPPLRPAGATLKPVQEGKVISSFAATGLMQNYSSLPSTVPQKRLLLNPDASSGGTGALGLSAFSYEALGSASEVEAYSKGIGVGNVAAGGS